MIEISLCMIVKNEEKVLARCLDSIVDLMDEIIIVDTGSTDRTKEIAARYTDKVYDFAWIDDFSAARNFAFSKATKDYIYTADADEVLDEENHKRFEILKEAFVPEIEVVQMKYGNQLSYGTTYNYDEEYRPKLFKRLREWTWIEPVHERMRIDPVVYDSDIVITHKPHASHAKRDFAVFQKYIKSGMRLSSHLHHMYAMELYISGDEEDFAEAEPFFLESLQDATRAIDEQMEATCIVCRSARLRKDADLLLKITLPSISQGGSSEIAYELAEYFYERNDYGEAAVWYTTAMNMCESILNIHTSTDWPEKRLAEIEKICNEIQE